MLIKIDLFISNVELLPIFQIGKKFVHVFLLVSLNPETDFTGISKWNKYFGSLVCVDNSIYYFWFLFKYFHSQFFFAVIIVFISTAQSQKHINVFRLFRGNPPKKSPTSNKAINEISDLKMFRGSRHDEFDWVLTNVSIIYYLI